MWKKNSWIRAEAGIYLGMIATSTFPNPKLFLPLQGNIHLSPTKRGWQKYQIGDKIKLVFSVTTSSQRRGDEIKAQYGNSVTLQQTFFRETVRLAKVKWPCQILRPEFRQLPNRKKITGSPLQSLVKNNVFSKKGWRNYRTSPYLFNPHRTFCPIPLSLPSPPPPFLYFWSESFIFFPKFLANFFLPFSYDFPPLNFLFLKQRYFPQHRPW
jgi:hypothetical protein